MELLIIGKDEGVERILARVAFAHAFGHKHITILFPRPDKTHRRVIQQLTERFPNLRCAVHVRNQQEASKARRLYAAVYGDATRELFESRAVTHIFEPEAGARPDFIHHRNSGLNQVLLARCKATPKRPGKEIVTTLALVMRSRRPETIIGRMQQNARFCRKYKVPYRVTSGAEDIFEQRDKTCLDALARTLLAEKP